MSGIKITYGQQTAMKSTETILGNGLRGDLRASPLKHCARGANWVIGRAT